jgi:ATP-binding cassette subfamily E protein 1
MQHRIAVLERDACNFKKCGHECQKFCPPELMGDKVIEFIDPEGYPVIDEVLCIGCGICTRKCPFDAIDIVNIATEIGDDKVHQYGVNTFRLYRLPIPKAGCVTGLVGKNGVGKTTAVNILSGSIVPNLGRVEAPPTWDDILDAYQGTELRPHFEKISQGKIKASVKPQAIYLIPKAWKDPIGKLVDQYDETGRGKELLKQLSLNEDVDKLPEELSGGELQRLAVVVAAERDADIYFFDEPSSFNDVYQRLQVSKVIRELAKRGRSVLLVEHDLTFLDYACDFVHIIYGDPGVYGIVSGPMTTSEGINSLLDGMIPGENIRFRDTPVTFDAFSPPSADVSYLPLLEYTDLKKSYPPYTLEAQGGTIKQSEVIGVLGANALGKTTFLKILASQLEPDEGKALSKATISYKPQYLSSDFAGTVQELLSTTSGDRWSSSQNLNQLIKPLRVDKLLDKNVASLSGGELQKTAVAVALLKEADIYALDEPSAFTDIEDRIAMAKAIQRYVKSLDKSAVIIDHDIMLVDIVSDSLIIFTGKPGIAGHASPPMPKEKGMNLFLSDVAITYRRDAVTGRPRVNKPSSRLDREQKEKGQYYYIARRGAAAEKGS